MRIKKSAFYAIGIILVVLIGGFFLFKGSEQNIHYFQEDSKNGDVQNVVISMKNYNYYPNTIKVKAGVPVSISLDSSVAGCFRDFTIRDFGIHKYLKTPQDTLVFTPEKEGSYTFACSMGMGTGVLVVE